MIKVTCWKCKEVSWQSDETNAVLRRSGQTFYCPWGHGAVYGAAPTEADELRRERDRLKRDAARLEERSREFSKLWSSAERRASAARGQVTRLKNRAAAGVCPCCNRSFENLKRHMATKHSGFTAEAIPDGAPLQ